MAAAVEHAGDAVFITDAAGVIQYVNPAFESLTGYLRSEAIGHTPNILKSGKHGAEFYARLWTTLREGRIWKARYTNRRKDGSFYETEATNSPVRNAKGEITGFVGVQKDVTERAHLEEQLRRSQRMEALGTLAGGIAHDFNNILTPVLGYVELMRAELPAHSGQAEYLRQIREAGQRGQDLVSKILMFGRQAEVSTQPVNLPAVAEQVLTLLRAAVPKSIAIQSSIAEGLSTVIADPTQMHQVLMNLCVNAVQAMPQGGELTVAMDTVELSDHTCYLGKHISGPFVRLTVTDTGIGIPEDVLSHIFEPFYTTKEVGKGTGLGLSTVFGIVQQHGGVIDLRSRVGEGSTFCVYLPVAAPDLPPAAGAGGRGSP
jgi:PAS domain S-box-containing protein